MAWCIKNEGNGTYFRQWTHVGPCFGGTKEEAQRFPDKFTAVRVMSGHFAFSQCAVERCKKKAEV